MPPQAKPVIDRLMARVDKTESCWLWTGSTTAAGHGQISRQPCWAGPLMVHRVTYEHFVAPIPEGHEVHHKCGVRRCVNPDHLQAMPKIEHSSLHGGHNRGVGRGMGVKR